MTIEQPCKVKFEYSTTLLRTAMVMNTKYAPMFLRYWLIACAATVYMIWRTRDPGETINPVGVLASILATSIIMFVLYMLQRFVFARMRAAALVRDNPLIYGPTECRFDEHGVQFQTAVSNFTASWSQLLGYKDKNGILNLYVGKTMSLPVPIAAFAPAELEACRALLKAHLKRLG